MKHKTALKLIADERSKQIAKGFTAAHDDEHTSNEIAQAAICYASPHAMHRDFRYIPEEWPFERKYWQPDEALIPNLVKAAALLIAEIERLQRLENKP